MKLFLTCAALFCAISLSSCRGLKEEFTWTRINYDWPSGGNSRQTRQSRYHKGGSRKPTGDVILFPGSTNSGATNSGSTNSGVTGSRGQESNGSSYIYENNIPMGANEWNDKVFITVPRRRQGVPSTLNYVWANSTQRHNVPLIPYPDWDTNSLPSPGSGGSNFVSVYRVAIDSCDRLWFVDTGTIEIPGNPQQVQPTALVIMDLRTDRIIQRHVFNDSLLRPNTNLASLTIDITSNRCEDAYAYIPDLGGFGLIVYSLRENRAWRVTHNYFYLEPLAGEFTIGGHSFQWNDGIFSTALSGIKSDAFKDLYFHSMAGFNLYKVSTRILKNETLATRSYHETDFKVVGNRGERSQTSQSALHAAKGILFLNLVNQNALGCWNLQTPLRDISIVHKDDRKMIYPSDVKISGDNVIVLTNTMPVFLYGTLDYDTTNFRVWVENVDKAVEGTKCGQSSRGRY